MKKVSVCRFRRLAKCDEIRREANTDRYEYNKNAAMTILHDIEGECRKNCGANVHKVKSEDMKNCTICFDK